MIRTVYLTFFALLGIGAMLANKANSNRLMSVVESVVVQPAEQPLQKVDTLTKADKLTIAYVPAVVPERPASFSDILQVSDPAPVTAAVSVTGTTGLGKKIPGVGADRTKKTASSTKPKSLTNKRPDVARAKTTAERATCNQTSNSVDSLLVALNLKSACAT